MAIAASLCASAFVSAASAFAALAADSASAASLATRALRSLSSRSFLASSRSCTMRGSSAPRPGCRYTFAGGSIDRGRSGGWQGRG